MQVKLLKHIRIIKRKKKKLRKKITLYSVRHLELQASCRCHCTEFQLRFPQDRKM